MKILRNFLGFILAPFVKGSSVVIKHGDTAVKISKPKLLVRLFYLVFCSRWTSPYESMKGMRRAFILRRVANHITTIEPWIGRPVFAEPIKHRYFSNKPALVTKWVFGEPVEKKEASIFLRLVENSLFRAGLPTWSVSNLNPKAHEDVIKTKNGLVCVDYESVLPNIFARNGNRSLEHVDMERLESFGAWAQENDYPEIKSLRTDIETLRTLEMGGPP